jgi:hypothetical protein
LTEHAFAERRQDFAARLFAVDVDEKLLDGGVPRK